MGQRHLCVDAHNPLPVRKRKHTMSQLVNDINVIGAVQGHQEEL